MPDLPDFLKLDGGPNRASQPLFGGGGISVRQAQPGIFAMGDALSSDEIEAAEAVADQFGPDFDPSDPESWQRTVGRNAICPCGSGKKFKHCHGLQG